MIGPRRPSARCRALLIEVSRYLDGELTPARRRIIARHLTACACCGTMAAGLRRSLDACRAEGRVKLPREVRTRAARRIRRLLDGNSRNRSAK